jgi:hypothetical protein
LYARSDVSLIGKLISTDYLGTQAVSDPGIQGWLEDQQGESS